MLRSNIVKALSISIVGLASHTTHTFGPALHILPFLGNVSHPSNQETLPQEEDTQILILVYLL
jgi:hypothetical protein